MTATAQGATTSKGGGGGGDGSVGTAPCGADCENYTSPTYGYKLSWHPEVWSKYAESSANGFDEVRIKGTLIDHEHLDNSPTAFVIAWGYEGQCGNAQACLETRVNDLRDELWWASLPVSKNPPPATSSDATGSLLESEVADTWYLECRSLGKGNGVVAVLAKVTAAYEEWQPKLEALLGTLALPGTGSAGSATTGGTSASSAATCPDVLPPPSLTTCPGYAGVFAGANGCTRYLSPIFGYHLEWQSPWEVRAATSENDRDVLVLWGAASDIQLTGYIIRGPSDPQECLAATVSKLQSDPRWGPLTPVAVFDAIEPASQYRAVQTYLTTFDPGDGNPPAPRYLILSCEYTYDIIDSGDYDNTFYLHTFATIDREAAPSEVPALAAVLDALTFEICILEHEGCGVPR